MTCEKKNMEEKTNNLLILYGFLTVKLTLIRSNKVKINLQINVKIK